MLEALAAACSAPAPCLGSSVAAQDAEPTGLGNISHCSLAWPLGAPGPVHGQIPTVASAGDHATQSGWIQGYTPVHSGLSGCAISLQADPGCYGGGLPRQCAVPGIGGLLPSLSAAMHGAATPPWPSTPGRSGQSHRIPAQPMQQPCSFGETNWWSQGNAPTVPGILAPTGLSMSAPCWQQPPSPAPMLVPLAPTLAAPPFTSPAPMATVPASAPTQLGQVDVRSAPQQQLQLPQQPDIAALHVSMVQHPDLALGTAVGVAAAEPAAAASPGRPREPIASSGALAMAAMAGEAFMEARGGSPPTTVAKAPLSLTQTVFHFRSPS